MKRSVFLDALVYKHGPSNGLVLFYDMKNFSAGHLLRNNLRSMKKFFAFVQEGSPVKIHRIHIFNTVPFFHLVMAIIKPFMQAELVEKVCCYTSIHPQCLLTCSVLFQMHLHSSSLDLDKFYVEHVPRSCLPSDFGGVCDSTEVLHEKMCKEFLELREYFIAEEKQAALEYD